MCGIFGIVGEKEAARIAYLGLQAVQHRGQDSAGICTSNEEKLYLYTAAGLVTDAFDERKLDGLPGKMAIGHTRYSTIKKGEDVKAHAICNAQPLLFKSSLFGQLAVCLNGNIVDQERMKGVLSDQGVIFSSETDTEILAHLIARSDHKHNFEAALLEALCKIQVAYCFLLLRSDAMYVARDIAGFRPLVLGRRGKAFVVASETCAFDLVGAEYLREIKPGEVLKIVPDKDPIFLSLPEVLPRSHAPCIFEHVYFARPDSQVFGRSVSISRDLLGRRLAEEAPTTADIVVPIPDSGVTAALGYSNETGNPLAFGLIRNHYVGRTFIEPRQSIRDFGVKIKLNPVREIISGKRVVLVDDSIVRATTIKKIVSIVRSAGASEVHVRITSPPIIGPCYYGIDTRDFNELIAYRLKSNVEAIREFIGADSLQYISLKGMVAAVMHNISPKGLKCAEGAEDSLCVACFEARYPHLPKDFSVFGI